MKKKNDQAFTIVELLIVIAVIGILAAITTVSYSGITARTSVATLHGDLMNASIQLENTRVSGNSNRYPATATNTELKINSNSTISYEYDDASNSYCLAITNDKGATYHITSTGKTPVLGECPIIPIVSISSTVSAWGGSGSDLAYAIIQTSDGGYALAGRTTSYGAGNYDSFLVKYDLNGNLSWNKTWGGTGYDVFNDLIQTSDGGYLMTGQSASFGAGSDDAFLVKYDLNGNLSWNKTLGGINSDKASSLIQTSDGGYAIVGQSASFGAGADDAFLVKYDSSGNLSWSKTWGGTGADISNDLIQTSDGGYAIVGQSASFGAGDDDAFLVKYDSSGNLSWNKTWGWTGRDRASSLIQTSDGGYAIAGQSTVLGVAWDKAFLVKYDSSGNLSWNKTFGGPSFDIAYDLTQTSDGGYAIAGYTSSYGAGIADALFAKYNSVGSINNCNTTMCKSLTPTVTSPTSTVTLPTPTVTSPTPTVTLPTPTVTLPTATNTVIVAPL